VAALAAGMSWFLASILPDTTSFTTAEAPPASTDSSRVPTVVSGEKPHEAGVQQDPGRAG